MVAVSTVMERFHPARPFTLYRPVFPPAPYWLLFRRSFHRWFPTGRSVQLHLHRLSLPICSFLSLRFFLSLPLSSLPDDLPFLFSLLLLFRCFYSQRSTVFNSSLHLRFEVAIAFIFVSDLHFLSLLL